jgi:hypothetical protein
LAFRNFLNLVKKYFCGMERSLCPAILAVLKEKKFWVFPSFRMGSFVNLGMPSE